MYFCIKEKSLALYKLNILKNMEPLLSICIPIYNRSRFLEKMLERFMEDKSLFLKDIELIISDNCSSEDLELIVDNFREKGLTVSYNRNESNIGASGNFLYCFKHAKGKYCWLLGSDDIPVPGVLKKILLLLESNNYGLFHINCYDCKKENLKEFDDKQEFLSTIGYWITFMSSNIIRSEFINSVDHTRYLETHLIQVPYYLDSCLNSNKNAIFTCNVFEQENDFSNNGGYNIFEVFAGNLFAIYAHYVDKGLINKITYNKLLKNEFKDLLFRYIVNLLIFKKKSNYKLDNAWNILWRYYRFKPYFYLEVFIKLGKRIKNILKI